MKKLSFLYIAVLLVCSCSQKKKSAVPKVGFIEAFQDETVGQAKNGFTDALAENGFSEKKNTVELVYRNAQGDIPTLSQIVNYFISEDVDIIASSTTLATLSAIQKTKKIPVFMMVSPTPERMKVLDKDGKAPANLFGVMEDLGYIDTSFTIITQLVKPKGNKLLVGMIYNQSEPQSADAVEKIKQLAARLNVTVEAMPVNTSADAQLITQSLLSKNPDAFFANPDNTVFASFETIVKSCNGKNIPIFTSEAGLVKRGAVAAYGADMYQWGYQSGLQAAKFLKTGSTSGLKPEMVKVRKRVYNADAASRFHLNIPSTFEAVK
ncbi:ABC transporter substrate-binding protein [Pedobacter sp. HMF7647]|uniref:ABC transporter substrate-binding protein n=1 Tax=Hufsiella arboris TaxID=2695275 RepID=A0A7K1Y7U2_9SPHI|nr:ABC transporter substrate-binding protein [Hufsiella arboris]MXV50490.1 ABC transporter substrate-binding protein [Hufsiella arboris]